MAEIYATSKNGMRRKLRLVFCLGIQVRPLIQRIQKLDCQQTKNWYATALLPCTSNQEYLLGLSSPTFTSNRMQRFITLIFLLLLTGSLNAQLRINEICYDPSNNALDGDANGDGAYDQTQDEFIEFVNVGSSPLDISKYKIYDHVLATGVKTLRHTVANGIILPAGGAMVVFGGGTATGTFGGAYVAVDVGSAGLSLNNNGESVILTDSSGTVVDTIDTDALSDNPNESYTRNPDITGDFIQHKQATPNVLFSPGTRIDGTPFTPYTSVEKLRHRLSFGIYPNPGNGHFALMNPALADAELEILDLSGKVMLNQKAGQGKFEVQGLPAGMYLVRPTQLAEYTPVRLQIKP